jgi:short-subunit dehydrogenase
MLARRRGGIVMVASLAALAGAVRIAVYSAVKAFQVNFGEGLRAEMSPPGVDLCTAVLGHRRARMARPPDAGPDDRRTHQPHAAPHERHALLCDGSGSTC